MGRQGETQTNRLMEMHTVTIKCVSPMFKFHLKDQHSRRLATPASRIPTFQGSIRVLHGLHPCCTSQGPDQRLKPNSVVNHVSNLQRTSCPLYRSTSLLAHQCMYIMLCIACYVLLPKCMPAAQKCLNMLSVHAISLEL